MERLRRKGQESLQSRSSEEPESSNDAHDNEVTEKPSAGFLERFTGRKSRIAAALLTAGSFTLEASADTTVASVPHEVSERIVEETLPAHVIEKAREQGFGVRVTLPKPEQSPRPSFYLIHIGQSHEATYPGFERAIYQGVVGNYQQRMYALYPQLLSACNSPIFQEGRDYDLLDREQAVVYDAQVQTALQNVEDAASAPPTSTEEASAQLAVAEEVGNVAQRLRRHPRAEELFSAQSSVLEALRKFADSASADDRNNEQFRNFELHLRLLETGDNPLVKSAEGAGPQFQASSRLFFEGKADLVGLERAEENQEAVPLLSIRNETIEAQRQMVKDAEALFKNTPDGRAIEDLFEDIAALPPADLAERADEFKSRLQELAEAEEHFIREHAYQTPEYQSLTETISNLMYKIHDVREMVAYERVQEFINTHPDYGGTGMKCAVMEYGNNHTFAESAQAWNMRSDVEVSFGIIEIKESHHEE